MAPKVRHGKTRRDKERGAFQKNQENKMLRVQWQQECAHLGHKNPLPPFPARSCNGKRNRFVK